MMVDNIHPSPARLAAFASGELDEQEIAGIEAHLNACDACWKILEQQPESALIALVRSAGEECEALDGQQTDAPSEFDRADPAFGIPAELNGHPKYEVLSCLGSGGMGFVLKAHHRVMKRPVALKVIKPHLLADRQVVERFRREIQAAAQLNHPHVAHAYDAEQLGDMQVLVLEYVQGDSLADVVKRDGPLAVGRACEYVRQAAAGLQHAADRGMVHRDIKPRNLMLALDDKVKILDFGLARLVEDLDDTASLTSFDTAMGTPDYIAPEQAEDAHRADIRADIYSLGCTLYYLLAGRPPFPVRGHYQKVDAHRSLAPTPITQLRDDVPPGLPAVLDKMMAKDLARRYQAPAEVADALAPFAREPAPQPASRKKPRSHRKILAAAGVAVALLFAAILQEGKRPLLPSAPVLTLSRGAPAVAEAQRDQPERDAPAAGTATPNAPAPVEPIGQVLRLEGHLGPVHSVAFSPDGRYAVSGSDDKTIRLWDLQSGEEIRQFTGSEHHVLSVAFSSDGSRIISGGEDRIGRLWDTASGEQIRTFRGHAHKIWRAVFSPDDTMILTGSEDGTIRLWAVQTGVEIGCLGEDQGVVTSVVFSPDGRYALSGSLNRSIRLWDVHLRKQVRVLPERPDQIWSVAVSPDGKRALSGGYGPNVLRLWDLSEGAELAQSQQHPHWIHCVTFSADGRYALSCSSQQTIHLWECDEWREIMSFCGHEGHVWCVAFSPDGRFALSGSADHTVRLWRLPVEKEERNRLRRGLPPTENLVVWSRGVIIRGSFCHRDVPLTALNDGILPQSSDEARVPRMGWARLGTMEWVSYMFPEPRQVSQVRVYWYDDTARGCRCRVPQQWRLLWRTEAGEWQPVALSDSEYPTGLDQFHEVRFPPVTTDELKMEIVLYPGHTGGLFEWGVE